MTSGKCVLKHVLYDSVVGSFVVAVFARPTIQKFVNITQAMHLHMSRTNVAFITANSSKNWCIVSHFKKKLTRNTQSSITNFLLCKYKSQV